MSLYVVTGAAGFIGRSIVSALLREGATVRGVDNLSTGKRENLVGLEAMQFIEGDLCDPHVSAAACNGATTVFHQAALASVPRSVSDPLSTNEANVNGTLQLLIAAQRAKVKRIVYAGSSSAYGNGDVLPKQEEMLCSPESPYAVSKLAGEHYMQCFSRVYGLETVTLRYFNVFGPHQDPTSQYSGVLARFILQMLRGETPTLYGDGEQSRDFTYIQNVVQANLLAAKAPTAEVSGRVFNVAMGVRISLKEIVETLRGLTGYRGELLRAGERQGDVKHSCADISAAKRHLGYRPVVNFDEGLRRTVEWYRTQPMFAPMGTSNPQEAKRLSAYVS